MDMQPATLLVCTVGGSPQPLVQSLCRWRPERVLFVPSEQTSIQVDVVLREYAERQGQPLSPGAYERFPVRDAESLDGCLEVIRKLDDEVRKWRGRGGNHEVVADFTAGTKCMTAALALQARRWTCTFSYVGGAQRSKEGVGVVESGTERVVHSANPWDALGHQAVEDFIVLFDQRAFDAAAKAVKRAKRRVSRASRKREFSALEQLAKAFDYWDRFDHRKSSTEFDHVHKNENDIREVLGLSKADQVLQAVVDLGGHLGKLCNAEAPSRHHVIDLLANAQRRHKEGRTDDAVARLYRAIEAVAQVTLKEGHDIESTEKVALERVPRPLREEWKSRAKEGLLSLGLQDAFTLLGALGDPLAQRFQQASIAGQTSPLTARNRSILAHGFERVSQKVFDKLWAAALSLADVEEARLPAFPTIGDQPHGEH